MTSAAETQFAFESVDVGSQTRLWVDGNSKITADNGDFHNPKPNAFSLVQIKDCPSSTEACRASCYVNHIEKHRPDIHSRYKHNSTMIRWLLSDPHRAMTSALFFATWISSNVTQFRWHVSGDVFSEEYAKWIRQVVRCSSEVEHWIYTRSFDYVPLLRQDPDDTPNLVINLSVDRDNYSETVAELADDYDLRLCYMAQSVSDPNIEDLIDGDVIFPDYPLRGKDGPRSLFPILSVDQKKMVCPVDTFGKSPALRCGPCKKCLRQK